MLKAFGLNPDDSESLDEIPDLLRALSPEAKAQAMLRMAGLEDYMRRRRVRYPLEAYSFVRNVVRIQSGIVTPAMLLDELRAVAIEKFGNNARGQLREWGITRCEDFGEIVFRLVEEGLLNAEPHETREDFRDGYDFEAAFPAGE
jgi:uncharacterized repeat protein (TIGR04138 family)